MPSRPDPSSLIGQDSQIVPQSCQRIMQATERGEHIWIGPEEATTLSPDDQTAYEAAHTIMRHIAVRAPVEHNSGHPGGSLSAFTFAYFVSKRRDPSIDQPLRYSAGHLSLLAYTLQWLFGKEGDDERLQSPEAIIKTFRTAEGLPGHVEAGIGDIPFGTGPLGKGVSNALGAAFGLQYIQSHSLKPITYNLKPIVDVLMADGDAQEGQIMEAFRLAPVLHTDNLIVHGDFNDIQLSDMPSKIMASDFASIAHATGWHVIEVQNGNDPTQVIAALDQADALVGKGRPIFICYYTTMGHGISFMEEGSNTGSKNYHGSPLSKDEAEKALTELSPLEDAVHSYEKFRNSVTRNSKLVTRNLSLSWNPPSSYSRTITDKPSAARKEFGATHLKNLMKADERIVVLHADLAGSGGFDKVQKEFPDRVINVGVAEANMVMMAAGLRQVGLLPVTYTFGAFTTNEGRASARLIDINCDHTHCGVLHDCTHVGLSVGEDGETHQEQNYLNIPFRNTQVWMPADSNQSAAMAEKGMEIIAEGTEIVFVFSPRTDHPQVLKSDGTVFYDATYSFDGHIDLLRGAGDASDRLTIIATGSMVHTAIQAADQLCALPKDERLHIRVLNAACIRPLDAAAVLRAAYETQHLLVLEDHNTEGGLASQIADVIADFQLPCSLRRLGLNQYFPSAKAEDLLFFAGLDIESVLDAVRDEIRKEVCGSEDAFVTSIFALLQNARQSRFYPSVLPFIDWLTQDNATLNHLRSVWQKRTCPTSKLPTNAQLREKLGAVNLESLDETLSMD